MAKPKLVEPDLNALLELAHRRWIETRDPKDGDRFADLVLQMSQMAAVTMNQNK